MSKPITGLSTSRIALVLSAFMTAMAAAMFTAAPALAHDQVVSASPSENESLASAPSEVVIEFTAELLDTGALINVTNASGQDVTDGEVTLDGRIVSKKLQPNLPNGQYELVWRVVSADGHPITDKYQFAIGEPVVPTDTAGAPNNSDANQATGSTEDAPVEDIIAITSTPDASRVDWGRIASVALLGAFAGVALYAAITALIRRSKTRNNT